MIWQSVLLPDGTPDIHFRNATGGQKLRDIMLDSNIELYGPYVMLSLYLAIFISFNVFDNIIFLFLVIQSRPLLNCAGGGTCATCMVEVF